MCTSMMISKNDNHFFGRTMDFSYELDPEVYIVPKNYEWENTINKEKIINKNKFIGTGQNINPLIFVDGVNEHGLGVAALYFPDYAVYEDTVNKDLKYPIASIELVIFLLGNCNNIENVIKTMKTVDIIGVKDSVTNTIAPIHWIVVDKFGKCITIEQTKKGLQIFNNPLKVLTNSPNFEWHMSNLRNYVNLSPIQKSESEWGNLILKPFGQGAGTYSLPGDYTSPSRFVRVAFQKSFVDIPKNNIEIINACFNVMKCVTIPKGVIIANNQNPDYTQYTVFMDINNGSYYFNTQYNNQILKANINDIETSELISLGKLKRISNFNNI